MRGPETKRMRAAYHADSALQARALLEALARELDKTHPGAAGSLREGMTETLTVLRLDLPPTLARTLRSTNAIAVREPFPGDLRPAADPRPNVQPITTGRFDFHREHRTPSRRRKRRSTKGARTSSPVERQSSSYAKGRLDSAGHILQPGIYLGTPRHWDSGRNWPKRARAASTVEGSSA
jgi:hypothetical protein